MTSHLFEAVPHIPVNFVRGDGCWLSEEGGRRFLDLESGSWAALLGHGHPAVNRALSEQLEKLMHLGVRTPNHLGEEAARALLDLAGIYGGQGIFLSSGSEAVEFAVQVAKSVRPGRLLLGFHHAYLSAWGSSAKKDPAEWLLLDRSAAYAEDPGALLAGIPFERVGAFVFEPGGGSPWFARFPGQTLVREICRRVQEAGGLVIANEVTTGLGRTGRWFGYEHYGITPDLVALGKGLGNGYPVSATLLTGAVAEEARKAQFRHAQSHQNNPLGCAVALGVLQELKRGDWIRRGAEQGKQLLDSLQVLARTKVSSVQELRGRGMLVAIELRRGGRIDGATLQSRLLERGIITGGYPVTHPAGTGLRLDPPLIINKEELSPLIEALDELLE